MDKKNFSNVRLKKNLIPNIKCLVFFLVLPNFNVLRQMSALFNNLH